MHFRELPPELQQAVKNLTRDKIFQDRFGHDEILNELDGEKFDPALCYIELCCMIGVPQIINNKKFKAVSLLQYCYLWCLENPLVKKMQREAEEIDLDVFFYTLNNDVNEDALSLATKAIGETKRLELSIDEAKNIANYLINLGFYPLKMFPQTATVEGSKDVAFDVDWITSIIAKVHEVTGYSPETIMKMPLNTACFYYIQWARLQGCKDISKRTNEEILQAQSERTDMLIAERFIELGIIKEEDKQDFLNKIKTPPKK